MLAERHRQMRDAVFGTDANQKLGHWWTVFVPCQESCARSLTVKLCKAITSDAVHDLHVGIRAALRLAIPRGQRDAFKRVEWSVMCFTIA